LTNIKTPIYFYLTTHSSISTKRVFSYSESGADKPPPETIKKQHGLIIRQKTT